MQDKNLHLTREEKNNLYASVKTSCVDIRDAFFNELFDIASQDNNVVFLTADMSALSLERFKNELKSQFFNVGIAEQNMISVAAGLALGGKVVFVYAVAPFVSLRCYEQIKVELCGMNLNVHLIASGPGLAYSSDGPTHHAVQDIAIMRALPEMTIINPCDSITSSVSARIAYKNSGPTYIRIDKGVLPLVHDINIGNWVDGFSALRAGRDLTIISTGIMVHKALEVADKLTKYAIDAGVVDIWRIHPIDSGKFLKLISQSPQVVTLEEHLIVGGIGSLVSEVLTDNSKTVTLTRIGINECGCHGYGDREWMHVAYGLDSDSIINVILSKLHNVQDI